MLFRLGGATHPTTWLAAQQHVYRSKSEGAVLSSSPPLFSPRHHPSARRNGRKIAAKHTYPRAPPRSEGDVLAPRRNSDAVQACSLHHPALRLSLAESLRREGYGRAEQHNEPSASRRDRRGTERRGGRGEELDRGLLPVLTTELGAAWMLNTAGGGSTSANLRLACQVAEFPARVIMELTGLLANQVAARELSAAAFATALTECLHVACPTHVASLVLGVQTGVAGLERADGGISTPSSFPSNTTAPPLRLSRWHMSVAPPLAKQCLQHVSDTIREQRGRRDALPSHTLQALHACAMCELPRGLEAGDTLRTELAIVAMSALKYATYPQLESLYFYLDGEHVTVPAVLNKFLANCGMLLGVTDAAQRVGTPISTVTTYPRGETGGVARSARAGAAVKNAVQELVDSGRDIKYIEEGLVHGCSVLSALGYCDEVRAVYQRFPSLRATPHLVSMYVSDGDVAGALRALDALANSRPEGWVRFPPIVQQSVLQTSELVGCAGTPADVGPLYVAIVSFHNAGMIVSQVMESLLAGVCERVRSLTTGGSVGCGGDASSSAATPRAVLEQVLPITKAVLPFIGDDVNTDMILALLETALETGSMAVPLTSALMGALRQATSLSIRELFQRVDQSTHNVPFLYYYALCFARDRGLVDTVEHLSTVWHVDSRPILQREPHLAPPYKLWKCAGCGRVNSDRYNYCVCSALRNGFVVCGGCGYGQDERWPACLSCGGAMDRTGAASGVVRKAWTCSACKSSNPARQTLLCFRCSQPTGPLLLPPASQGEKRDAKATAVAPFCRCDGTGTNTGTGKANSAYDAKVGFCRGCGRFRVQDASRRSFAWRCVGCGQLRSSLERTCPSCPQVDCLPFARAHKANAVRCCAGCGAMEENAFADMCSRCGSAELRESCAAARLDSAVRPELQRRAAGEVAGTGSLPDPQLVLLCPHCSNTQRPRREEGNESTACEHCGAAISVAQDGILSVCRKCPTCQHTLQPTLLGALCPYCASYVPPTTPASEWQAPQILHTFITAARLFDLSRARRTAGVSEEKGSQAEQREEALLLEKLNAFLLSIRLAWCHGEASSSEACVPVAALSDVRVGVIMELNTILTSLRSYFSHSLPARRAAAQTKQLLAWIDTHCGLRDQRHFTKEEVCHECLGGHPEELCVYHGEEQMISARAEEDGAPQPRPSPAFTWTCVECGAGNTNQDVCRYLCTTCLALRPAVQELLPTECWECACCHRANVEFETYCTHCGNERPATAVSSVTTGVSAAGTEAAATAQLANNIPFLPCRCALCGLVYLEATCPLCANHLPDVAEAEGVVCAVGKRHAYIQPLGTNRAEDRVFVSERLVRGAQLSEGKVVHYLAELGRREHGVSYHATHIR